MTEAREVARLTPAALIRAGSEAPSLVVRHVVESQGSSIAAEAARQRARDDFHLDDHLKRVVRSHLMLARSQGAGGGALIAVATVPAASAGPVAALATAVPMVLADLTTLAYIQLRLVLHIAAAHGHDATDPQRVTEILALSGLDIAAGKSGTKYVGAASQRVSKRLLEKYLRGNALQAVTSMFALVGIRFSRAALLRGLPLVNIPVGAAVSDVTTRRIARKATAYYSTLPV